MITIRQCDGIILIILVVIFTFGGTSATFTKRPKNLAALAGSFVRLDCALGNPQTVIWWEHITNPDGVAVASNDVIANTSDKYIYNISHPSTGVYNLGINLLDRSGGRYRCQQVVPTTIEANLHVIVLATEPQSTSSIPLSNIVAENEIITFSCQLNYTGDDGWKPKVEWQKNNMVISDTVDESSGKLVKLSVKRGAAPDMDGAVYSVKVYFKEYSGSLPSDYATNIPDYIYTYTFDQLTVHYGPKNVLFDPHKSIYMTMDEINCKAQGNPAVSFTWIDLSDNSTIVNGSVLHITFKMLGKPQLWRCMVSNEVIGETKTAFKDISFLVTLYSESKGHPTVNTQNYRTGLLEVASLATLLFIWRIT